MDPYYEPIVAVVKLCWEQVGRDCCEWKDITAKQCRDAYARVLSDCAKSKGQARWSIKQDSKYITSIPNLDAKVAYIAKMAHWWRKRAMSIVAVPADGLHNPEFRLPGAFAKAIEQVYFTEFAARYGEEVKRRVGELVETLHAADPIDGNDTYTKQEAVGIYADLEARRVGVVPSESAISGMIGHAVNETEFGRTHLVVRKND